MGIYHSVNTFSHSLALLVHRQWIFFRSIKQCFKQCLFVTEWTRAIEIEINLIPCVSPTNLPSDCAIFPSFYWDFHKMELLFIFLFHCKLGTFMGFIGKFQQICFMLLIITYDEGVIDIPWIIQHLTNHSFDLGSFGIIHENIC